MRFLCHFFLIVSFLNACCERDPLSGRCVSAFSGCTEECADNECPPLCGHGLRPCSTADGKSHWCCYAAWICGSESGVCYGTCPTGKTACPDGDSCCGGIDANGNTLQCMFKDFSWQCVARGECTLLNGTAGMGCGDKCCPAAEICSVDITADPPATKGTCCPPGYAHPPGSQQGTCVAAGPPCPPPNGPSCLAGESCGPLVSGTGEKWCCPNGTAHAANGCCPVFAPEWCPNDIPPACKEECHPQT